MEGGLPPSICTFLLKHRSANRNRHARQGNFLPAVFKIPFVGIITLPIFLSLVTELESGSLAPSLAGGYPF